MSNISLWRLSLSTIAACVLGVVPKSLQVLSAKQGTREVLIPAEMDKSERKTLEQMLEICEVTSSEATKGAFNSKHAEQARSFT
eukprot:scaffold330238_cov59-Tisochrysis_lutea.AAC.3